MFISDSHIRNLKQLDYISKHYYYRRRLLLIWKVDNTFTVYIFGRRVFASKAMKGGFNGR